MLKKEEYSFETFFIIVNTAGMIEMYREALSSVNYTTDNVHLTVDSSIDCSI